MKTKINKTIQFEAGDTVKFKGCVWDEELDYEGNYPCVIYSPCKVYETMSECCDTAVVNLLELYLSEDSLDDTSLDASWSDYALGIFRDYKWSTRFDRREKAIHVEITVKFSRDDWNNLAFKIVKVKKVLPKKKPQLTQLKPRNPK